MKAFIILVSNGPTVVVTELNEEKTVSNLIWRGFRDFNLYKIPESKTQSLIKDIGERTWLKLLKS